MVGIHLLCNKAPFPFFNIVRANQFGPFFFTYFLFVGDFNVIGEGDLHDRTFDDLVLATAYLEFDVDFAGFGTEQYLNPATVDTKFLFTRHKDLWLEHKSNEPFWVAAIVALIFVFTSSIFICYDYIVAKRQKIIIQRAMQTNAIVASLFPDAVRKRLYDVSISDGGHKGMKSALSSPKHKLNNYLSKGEETDLSSEPIAELFTSCTVLFADIAGFTAWCSERKPSQVFKLLGKFKRE